MPTPFDLTDCELQLFIQIHYPISIEGPLKESAYHYGTKPLQNVSDEVSLIPWLYTSVCQFCSSNVVNFGCFKNRKMEL